MNEEATTPQRRLTQAIKAAWDTPPLTTDGLEKAGVALMAGVAARVAVSHYEEQLKELREAVVVLYGSNSVDRTEWDMRLTTVAEAARRLVQEDQQ